MSTSTDLAGDAGDDDAGGTTRVITLVSDRGAGSEWVGTLHSVLAQLAPAARIIDLTHEVAVDDVKAASLTLARAVQYLAPGVILVSVAADLDPATQHVAIAAARGNAVFLGPDNGVMAAAVAMVGGAEEVAILDRADLHLESAGAVDPARDIYAPAAAQLFAGGHVHDLGSKADPARLRPGLLPLPSEDGDALVVEVLAVGHRGTVHINVDPAEIDGLGEYVQLGVESGRRIARRVGSRAELATGALGLLTDTIGMLSVVSVGSSAAEELRLAPGDQIRLEPASSEEFRPSVTTPVAVGSRGDRGTERTPGRDSSVSQNLDAKGGEEANR
jgi:S-adenosylmethionine hydrolase